MGLKAFHFGLILASALLMVFFGFWSVERYSDTGSTEMLVSGIASFTLALGLVAYLGWFLKKLKNVPYI